MWYNIIHNLYSCLFDERHAVIPSSLSVRIWPFQGRGRGSIPRRGTFFCWNRFWRSSGNRKNICSALMAHARCGLLKHKESCIREMNRSREYVGLESALNITVKRFISLVIFIKGCRPAVHPLKISPTFFS